MKRMAAACVILGFVTAAQGTMVITEFMYSGYSDGTIKISEFVEFTNIGTSPVNMAGWSYDDDSRTPGSVDLSAFGIVQPGESVILAEGLASDFITGWGLSGVKVIGSNSHNLGRADEINLYDASSMLVDRLTYNDQGSGSVAGPRARYYSANPPSLASLGTNYYADWGLSSVGDVYGSWANGYTDVANPGVFTLIPEPATAAFLALGGMALLRRYR